MAEKKEFSKGQKKNNSHTVQQKIQGKKNQRLAIFS